ncbi:hypothetical protein B4923_20580 [Brenneria roseae subsp. americana]|uniref:Uncharacterized protein n=1 Tax=Brenneria roseae subsp. americana TaxID=1508507 RepID=A0A2U1TIK0_9GAMM|nr:hypothetical protein B4923_20580 [Brenneria roseae subsp. americana]
MKKARFTETQILPVLKEVEGGRHVTDVCRENGVSEASYYNWKAKYGGMESSDIKRMKELEEENRRLKQMYASLSLDHEILKELAEDWRTEYNEERPHSSLGDMPPVIYARQKLAGDPHWRWY